MEKLPRFFAMFGFLFLMVVESGCASSPPPTPGRLNVQPIPKTESFYSEVVENGALARYMRGEMIPAEYVCVPNGEFNLGPDGAYLLMKTWCVRRHGHKRVVQVEDQKAPLIEGKPGVYRIPFRGSVVTVEGDNGVPLVSFHYRDEGGEFHHMDLQPRHGEEYRYSFKTFTKEEVEAVAFLRVIGE